MNGIELREQIKRFIQHSNHEWVIFGNELHEKNSFDDSDLDYLINEINKHKPHMLGLANLGLNDHQAAYIAKDLHGNTSLKCLYLPFNKIGDIGAKAIGELLTTKPALTQLILFYNRIRNAGMISIANGLIANDTLLELEAFLNPFSTEITGVFEKILRLNHHLENVLLYSPTGDIKESSVLLSRLADNKHRKKLQHLSMFKRSNTINQINSSRSDLARDSSRSTYLL